MRPAPFLLLLLIGCTSGPSAPPPVPGVPEKPGPRPDRPSEAALFRYRQRLSADGTMPPDALVRAKAQRDAMVAAQGPIDIAGLSPAGWRWLGPRNVGGRTRSILIHPTRPEVMWLGSVSGGIWKTLDGGATWIPLDDFLASLAVSCMALDPTNPDVLYAGTGEGFFNGDAVRGAGIFRSTDGGTTWARIPTTNPSPPGGPAEPQWHFVNRIAIDPTNPLVILAGTNEGLYRTVDGGATAWSMRTLNGVVDVDFRPGDPTRAVAGQRFGRALYSADGGLTWIPATGLPPADGHRVELAYAPAAPDVVFASVARRVGGVFSTAGIFRSLDGGRSYEARNATVNYLGGQGGYDNAIWVDPTDAGAQRLVVGGIDLWRSFDAGTSLTKISDWRRVPDPGDSAHADQHAIVAHPDYDGTTNRIVFIGNDGGIYRAADILTVTINSGWTSLNNGLGITQFYGAAVNPVTSVLVGGTQDNATLRHASTSSNWTGVGWVPPPPSPPTPFFTGDGGFCAATSEPGGPGTFFGEFPYLDLFRSTDGGLTSRSIHAGIADALEQDPIKTNFISPFVLDPNNSNRLLAGGTSLWLTTGALGAVPTWNVHKPPTPTGSFLSAIAVAPGNPDIIWVAHNDGEVYQTTNGTSPPPAVWTRVDRNGIGLPIRFPSRIVIDPRDHDRVWVTFMGFEADSVWRTTDGGMTWEERTGGRALPSIPATSLVLHPTERDWVYLGTDLGVFASTDGGGSWSAATEGPANVVVDEVLFQGSRTLLAVTHGRGVFEAVVGPMPVPIPGRTTRVSVSSTGQQGNGASGVDGVSMSSDGRFVTFQGAGGLIPTFGGVVVHDRMTAETAPVSVSSAGELPNSFSGAPSISADGRFVAFASDADNLVPNDTNRVIDVFVRDLRNSATTRVSVSSTGQEGNARSAGPRISANGRYVIFESSATNLVPGDTNGQVDVFVHDRQTRRTVRASVSTAGVQGDGHSRPGSVSDEGLVAFSSVSTNLVAPGNPGGRRLILTHDLTTGQTTEAVLSPTGQRAGNFSDFPRITPDGRFLAFESLALNLVPGSINQRNVFVRDLGMGTNEQVNVSSTWAQPNGPSSLPEISPDGRFVVFHSDASNLVPGDTNLTTDTFIRDRTTFMTARVSVSSTGREANGFSYGPPSVSADGRLVAFVSAATNLVPDDTNNADDVFVHDAFPVVSTTDPARPGAVVRLSLESPDDPNREYVLGASFGTVPGISLTRRVIPLNPDLLLLLSLGTPAIFRDFIGVLDGAGRATPAIHLPAESSLVGLRFFTAWFTRRPGAPDEIGAISLPLGLTIAAN